MAIRKILLPLIGGVIDEAAVATALLIANRWNAHVLALHLGGGRDAARSQFTRAVEARNIPIQAARAGLGHPTAGFVALAGDQDEVVAHQGRLADLTVVSHPAKGEAVSSTGALHAALFDSGRPVMIAPRQAPSSIGERICLAWNGTAESAASVQLAMPWIKTVGSVRILAAEAYQRRGPEAAALAGYLTGHGIETNVVLFSPVRKSVGAGLLNAAREFGCDLLSMGAYSHSKLRQSIVGGVTQHVLENSDLPVMMSR